MTAACSDGDSRDHRRPSSSSRVPSANSARSSAIGRARPRPPVGFGGVGVVPGLEDLGEDPLRPAVVAGVGRVDRAALVVAQAEAADLAPVGGDVLGGGDRRVRAGLHGELLGRQPEGVEAHRVEHVAAGHPLVAAVDVGAGEAQRVADVEPGARRVREHVEHEQLRAAGGDGLGVGQRSGRVRRLERAVGVPVLLPAQLDLLGERGGVAVRAARRRRWFGAGASVDIATAQPTSCAPTAPSECLRRPSASGGASPREALEWRGPPASLTAVWNVRSRRSSDSSRRRIRRPACASSARR